MKISKIINFLAVEEIYNQNDNITINNMCFDSKNVTRNSLFFCYDGTHKGKTFVDEAIKNGAVCIITEKELKTKCMQIVVKNIRKQMAALACFFYGTKNLKVIGITGTNGKTTTSFMIRDILEFAGKKVGLIGTSGSFYQGEKIETTLTTPNSIELHKTFAKMKNAEYIVMEVSAHAIDQFRVFGINFVCKILTNITQDHLDYFKDMQTYSKAKLSFFDKDTFCVVNCDDCYGMQLKQKFDNCVSCGIDNPSDVFCVNVNNYANKFVMNVADNLLSINYNFCGLFNVYNAMAACACCYYLGVDIQSIEKGINQAKGAEGRYSVIPYESNNIIIDFAHTPDGLENVLKTARKMTKNKLICVFGCGGDRDRGKRPIMASIAEKYCDFVFVTIDNPRFEDTKQTLADTIKGFNGTNFYQIVDRGQAIALAISSLKENSTLIICGKGAENYLDIKGVKYKYSDFDEVYKCINANNGKC